jgi:hypothetical protein
MGDKTEALRKWFIHRLQGSSVTADTPPVVSTIGEAESFFQTVRTGNKYEIFDAMVRKDTELSGVINGIGLMCGKYYNGISLRTDTGIFTNPAKVEDKQLSQLLTEAQLFAGADYGVGFPKLFISTAKTLQRYGDMVIHLVYEQNKGITELQPLPMKTVTAVENATQKTDISKTVTKANIYYVNEGTSDEKEFQKDSILHISLDNFAELVRDIKNRMTFGVWSVSPLEPLQLTIRWKLNTILNDILWRHRSVPREHHKINLSQFVPENYTGTTEDKVKAAQTAAKLAADNYKAEIKPENLETDQAYITDQNTEITYVEPRTATYSDPNLLISQQNEAIHFSLGYPSVAKQSYASAYYSTSFGLMKAEVMGDIIRESLEALVRKHLKIKFGEKYPTETLACIAIESRLILERDRSELARQISILAGSNSFTDDELREIWGKGPLTEDQRKIMATQPNMSQSTPERSARDSKRKVAPIPGMPQAEESK